MKVAGEDLYEILSAIDRVSGQVIVLGLGHVDQVNGEELDDEEVIICLAHPVHKVVVL
jgi:hypothetical protein